MGCFFCRGNGLDESLILKEGKNVLVVANMFPGVPGHVLVIPRGHYRLLNEVPDEVSAEMFQEAIRAGDTLKDELGIANFNILTNEGPIAGQTVDHVHTHVFPRTEGDNLLIRRRDTRQVKVSDGMLERLIKAFV